MEKQYILLLFRSHVETLLIVVQTQASGPIASVRCRQCRQLYAFTLHATIANEHRQKEVKRGGTL